VQLKKQIQTIDRQMRELQDKIGILDKALEDPAIYSTDPKKAADFARLRTRLADDLETAEINWLASARNLGGGRRGLADPSPNSSSPA
jgi:ATP-binding cassette subfamily F protein 3